MPKLRLLILLCIATTLPAADESNLTPEQLEIINVHNKMREAVRARDFAAWSPSVADDCIFTGDDGEITTKAKIIQHMRNLPLTYDHSENQRDFVVHVYGNTAVLNLRFTTHEQFTDTDIIGEMRETETYIREDQTWLLVARQWGALPVNLHKPAAAASASYKDFVGEYAWRPGGPIDTVSFKDGKLLTRLNDESEENQYLPLGHETFFLQDDWGTMIFVRDPQHHVRGYTYRRPDGQEVHVKKIK